MSKFGDTIKVIDALDQAHIMQSSNGYFWIMLNNKIWSGGFFTNEFDAIVHLLERVEI